MLIPECLPWYLLDLLQVALWVGNEFTGLSDVAIESAKTQLFIPMRGMIQSLNLSVLPSPDPFSIFLAFFLSAAGVRNLGEKLRGVRGQTSFTQPLICEP